MDNIEFDKIKKFSEASGSIAVLDNNVKMILNEFGLFEEEIIDSAINLKDEALYVSPNFNENVNESIVAKELYQGKDNIKFDERLGFYESLFVGHVSEGNYRENASSGGMGTWIFKELFDNNLIDYVIHVKKDKEPDSKTLFKYDISTNLEEIMDGAKTKYYPVEFSGVFEILMNNPGRYAIVGIPSFIYAVRLLAKKNEIINERIRFTIGLICGHQKSSKFADSMAWQVGIEPGKLMDIDFRYKLVDRPASAYGVKMTGVIDGKVETVIKPTSELFGQNWGWGMFKSIASDYTDDVFNETADIVLGDAWLPKYEKDSKGNNIIIIRNTIIQDIVSKANEDGRLNLENVDVETIFQSQASHFRHTHDELAYRLAVKDKKNEWRPKKRVIANYNISAKRREIQDLRKKISEQSNISYSKAVSLNDFGYFVDEMTTYIKKYSQLYYPSNWKSRVKRIKSTGIENLIKKIINKMKTKNS